MWMSFTLLAPPIFVEEAESYSHVIVVAHHPFDPSIYTPNIPLLLSQILLVCTHSLRVFKQSRSYTVPIAMPMLGGGRRMQRLVSLLKTAGPKSSSSSWDFGDSDIEDEQHSPCSDVPKGCLAVYVGIGKERQRFVVGTHLLSNPLFKALLDRAAEEYGFSAAGALKIPCDAVLFEHFLWLLGRDGHAAALLEVNELLDFYSMQ